jgi:hypothetical protein
MVHVLESTLESTSGEVIVNYGMGPIHHVFLWIRPLCAYNIVRCPKAKCALFTGMSVYVYEYKTLRLKVLSILFENTRNMSMNSSTSKVYGGFSN